MELMTENLRLDSPRPRGKTNTTVLMKEQSNKVTPDNILL